MKEINENDFGTHTANGLVLVDFGAEWCGPCKTMLPILTRVSEAYGQKLAVYSIDTDRNPDLAARLGVMSLPTMLLFKDGKQVDRMVGVVAERELRKRIDATMGA